MNRDRIYFIRTRNRNRILVTLACRIVKGKLAFAIARAAAEEASPSRSQGRLLALERLNQVMKKRSNIYSPSYRRDQDGADYLMIGGILELSEVVPVLNRVILENGLTANCIPLWAYQQDDQCFSDAHRGQYLDMFCKIRNCVEKGTF